MLFSVLIANYNNSRFLKTALDSVLQQHYTNWEIVLIDDSSTDDFEKFIQPYRDNPAIKVYQNTVNGGCGFTKRLCAEKATGAILGFLDPDDALHPDALQVMVDAHSSYPLCSLISSTHFICDENLQVKRIAEYTKPLPQAVPYLLLGDGRVHAFATFKKSFYNKTTGIAIENKKAVDQDLYYKLEETGDLFFIDKPLSYYRIHDGSISNNGQQNEAQKYHYNIIEAACLRRIKNLKKTDPVSEMLARKYRTKYYKTRIFNSFRRRQWGHFLFNVALFPFVGGMANIVSYIKKIPKQGIGLLKQSFVNNYEIKA